MEYEELARFLRQTMSMTHIYQPVMIRKILESGGTATTDEIAREFLLQDDSLLEYYRRTVKRWPKKTLLKHKVVTYERDRFSLTADDLTEEEKDEIVNICNQRIEEYVDNYQDKWGVKTNMEPTGGIRYDVMAKSRGVCVACGMDSHAAALEVDHIIPVSRGGKTILSNLQALCRRCNAEKRNRDATDFVSWHKRLKYHKKGCLVCDIRPDYKMGLAFSVNERHPASEMHCLVAPMRHVPDFFGMIPAEQHHCMEMVGTVKSRIMSSDETVCGFDVGFAGGFAGDDAHCMIHVIPRREGDQGHLYRRYM